MAAMNWSALLLVVVLLLGSSTLREAQALDYPPKAVSFSTPPWDSRFQCSYNQSTAPDLPKDIICKVVDNQLILSNDNDVISVRYSYDKKVQLYKKKSAWKASFSTVFTVNIDRDSERSVKRVFGGGIAFAFTPNNNVGSSGPETFGLFEIDEATGKSLRGKKTKTVAVAIDTSRTTINTVYDPQIPHVELDINSVNSVKSSFLWNGTEFVDRKIAVFIDYDAKKEFLAVRFQNLTDTGKPNKRKSKLYLAYNNLKLSDYLGEKSYVGFSSRIPVTTDGIYRIYDWKFSTKWVR
eukprot:TRINITY_DN53_c0_g1_i1.p1 TRINITY_DN53_c0_g1~~TRINITY_DN53_c0_g1_i1.p1  ORF type:complete len:294 (-),score=37.15 TRINITY_DN53_c0_g1_i1:486-1367(-)